MSSMRDWLLCAAAGAALLIPAPAMSQDAADVTCWHRGERADLANRASPFDSASVELAGGEVKVCYSRPRKLGRVIMGGLVPYDQPWRLGANEATAVYVPTRAEIGGVAVEPGWYSLYAIPGETEWRVVVNESVERWGIPIRDELRARDVGEAVVAVGETPEVVEMLTIALEPTGDDAADMVISWDRTRVVVPVVLRE